ncbi:unnamed protein product [Cylicocyclus nassatus]|uniref:Peptidase S1 domain-containing protein n=1 Tax=Cylicocyclus nassatus TaxID=53992 RepID=A0AA36M677_CYLNA|nr:unnamed protein product [Cylicocyclus nassatus]
MGIFACFLIILHITRGHKYDTYDAYNCGKSQINAARSSLGVRTRRSYIADAHSNDTSIGGDSTSQELDDNVTDDEDEDDFMQEKIMGGRRAERGELPWAVLLHVWKKKSSRDGSTTLYGGICGGTLISTRHVITAAHCFQATESEGQCSTSNMVSPDFVINNTEVFIGGTCSSTGRFGCTKSDIGRVYKVARAFYEDYFKFGCTDTHDIAILELAKDVPKTINHVCLPFMHKVEELEDPYLKLRTFGWGRDPLNHDNNLSPYLQMTDLGAKLPEIECRKSSKAKDTFCVKSGQQEFCRGDSGGGVTAKIRGRNYLMGVAIAGPPCDMVAKDVKARSHPQTCTDIMYYKKMIGTWILAKRSRKPKVVNLPYKKLHRLLKPITNPYWKNDPLSSIFYLPIFNPFPMF